MPQNSLSRYCLTPSIPGTLLTLPLRWSKRYGKDFVLVLRNAKRPNVRCRALQYARMRGAKSMRSLITWRNRLAWKLPSASLTSSSAALRICPGCREWAFCAGFRKPATSRLRRWPVKGFENWLIFYQPKRDGVEIVYVMHGARDIEG